MYYNIACRYMFGMEIPKKLATSMLCENFLLSLSQRFILTQKAPLRLQLTFTICKKVQ